MSRLYAIELNGLHCGLAVSYTDPDTKKLKVVVADHIKHTGKTVSLASRTYHKAKGYRSGYYTQTSHTLKLNTEVKVHDETSVEKVAVPMQAVVR